MSDDATDGTNSTNGGDARRPISSVSLGGYETATEAVVSVVSAITGVDSRELPPLRTYLDADALDKILARRHRDMRSTVRVGFVCLDYEIVVTGDGTVTVFEYGEADSADRDGSDECEKRLESTE